VRWSFLVINLRRSTKTTLNYMENLGEKTSAHSGT